ncbi:ABC transporter substrate-binding protein [Ramlibacter sp. PS3R-8]|uniref:ABC transporter substrate-binding protein n=1 Tax=Ramlibacter sp. PS3R-8 TaxID=3133437 RepID=UPI0030A054EC
MQKFPAIALRALFAAGSISLLAAISAPALALDKVKMGTPARVNIGYAPFIMTKAMGFFEQEGLDVEITEFLGTSVLVPQVANKSVDIGFPGADIVIISRQPGRDHLPVKFFYNVARKNPWEFVVPVESPIKVIGDLRGKKIGVGALANGNVPIARAMFAEMGMTAGKDYEFVPVGVGAPAVHAIRTKQIDVFNGFDATIAHLPNNGVQIRYLEQPEKYRALISNGFVAHDDTIKNRPDMLRRFGRAITKGIVACEANRELCVRAAWQLYPSLKAQGVPEDRAMAESLATLDARLASIYNFGPGPRKFGEYTPKMFSDYIDVLHGGGELKSKEVAVDSLYTNAFVEDFSKFDAAALQAQVRGLKAVPAR